MKKVLIGVAALLAVLVVAAIALPFIVPTGPVRDRIVAEVAAATGRDLRIDGPVRLSVFPSVAVTVGDVTLANAPGTSRPQMVQLGRLDVSVSLLPLLSGEIEVKRLILREPSIWLEVDENGTPNWVFDTAAPPAAAEPAPDAPTQGGFSIGDLRLGEVAIVDGRIGYLDVRSGQAYAIDDLDVEIALPSLDDPLAIDGDLVFQERALAFQLGVDTPRPLVEGGESDVRLSLAGNPLDFTFDGRLSTAGPPETSGRLSLTVPSLASVGDWLGLALPKEGLPVDRVALTGTLAGTPARIAFEEAALKVDDIEATGDLAVALDGPRPAIGGRLAVGLLDLDALLPPPADEPEAAAPAQSGAAAADGWSDEPVDLSGLNAIDADLRIDSGGVKLRDVVAGPTVLSVTLQDGVLAVDLAETSLFGGTVALQVGANAARRVPTLRLGLQADGVQAEPVLASFADFDRLSGATNAQVALTTAGSSQKAWVEALDGTAAMIFRDGAIKGVNLAAMVRNVATAFADPTAGETRQTDFAELGGSFQIADGVAKTSDLRLLAPLLRIEGRGQVSLPPRHLSMRVEPKLVADSVGQGGELQHAGLTVPVIVEGPFDDLSYRPDLEGLVTRALQDPGALRDQVEGLTDQLGGGAGASPDEAVRGLLEGLIGGDATPPADSPQPPEQQQPTPQDALRSLFKR